MRQSRPAPSRSPNERRTRARTSASLGDLWRDLARALFDSYRPELHYMRGPGPKWRAKHERVHAEAGFEHARYALALASARRRGGD
jgi:hypothetical protein